MKIKFQAYIKELNIILSDVTPYPDGTIGIGHKQLTEAIENKFEIYDDCISDKDGNHIVSIMSGDDWYWFEQNDIEIMQFTGLISSDGGCDLPIKEAYFGDIIEFYDTDGKKHTKDVGWDDKLNCISISGQPYFRYYESGYFQPSKIQFQIIGNIYQNPELLNNKV